MYSFSKEEYNSLRQEIISRVTILNTQSSSALATIISTWSIGIALFVFCLQDGNITDAISLIVTGFINSCFLIPIQSVRNAKLKCFMQEFRRK